MAGSRLRRASAVALVALAAGLAGCGGDDAENAAETAADQVTPEATQTETPTGDGQEIEVTAVEEQSGLGWAPADLSAQAGTVTITMDNPDGNKMPHTVAIEGNGVDESGEAVEAGATSTLTAELQAGEYTFYCPVGEHRQNGMEGTLTVE